MLTDNCSEYSRYFIVFANTYRDMKLPQWSLCSSSVCSCREKSRIHVESFGQTERINALDYIQVTLDLQQVHDVRALQPFIDCRNTSRVPISDTVIAKDYTFRDKRRPFEQRRLSE